MQETSNCQERIFLMKFARLWFAQAGLHHFMGPLAQAPSGLKTVHGGTPPTAGQAFFADADAKALSSLLGP
jgi:hypothetical protein